MLDHLAAGMTSEQIVSDFPELTDEDVRAAIAEQADRVATTFSGRAR